MSCSTFDHELNSMLLFAERNRTGTEQNRTGITFAATRSFKFYFYLFILPNWFVYTNLCASENELEFLKESGQ